MRGLLKLPLARTQWEGAMGVNLLLLSALMRRLALPWFPALGGSDEFVDGRELGDSPLSKLLPQPCRSWEGGEKQEGPQAQVVFI